MYNTAKELHIGIDLGLQQLNSNRKLNIEPAEKDWVLNTVMMQEINSRINPKSNSKGEGFEDTVKRVDDLESLKKSTYRVSPEEAYSRPLFNYGDSKEESPNYPSKAVYIPIPADYYRALEIRANVHHVGNINSKVVKFNDASTLTGDDSQKRGIYYTTVRIAPDSDAATLYKNFKYSVYHLDGGGVTGNLPLIDLTDTTNYVDETLSPTGASYFNFGMNSMSDSDGRFMIIRLALDEINKNSSLTGITAYWERFGHIYAKDSIVFVMNRYITYEYFDNHPSGPSLPPPTGFWFIHYTDGTVANTNDLVGLFVPYLGFGSSALNGNDFVFSEEFNDFFNDTEEISNYNAATFKEYPVRLIKSSRLSRTLDHQYAKPVYNSPIAVIRQNLLIVYVDSTYEIDKIELEYYKKPYLISIYNNQGCEVDSDSFRMELVDKTVQKLSSRLNDPNYPNIVRENLILE